MDEAGEFLSMLGGKWTMVNEAPRRIQKGVRTKNFVAAMDLLNAWAVVAEEEGHHPDFHLTGWNNVMVSVHTHHSRGLTENDFILAAKLDQVLNEKMELLSKKQP